MAPVPYHNGSRVSFRRRRDNDDGNGAKRGSKTTETKAKTRQRATAAAVKRTSKVSEPESGEDSNENHDNEASRQTTNKLTLFHFNMSGDMMMKMETSKTNGDARFGP